MIKRTNAVVLMAFFAMVLMIGFQNCGGKRPTGKTTGNNKAGGISSAGLEKLELNYSVGGYACAPGYQCANPGSRSVVDLENRYFRITKEHMVNDQAYTCDNIQGLTPADEAMFVSLLNRVTTREQFVTNCEQQPDGSMQCWHISDAPILSHTYVRSDGVRESVYGERWTPVNTTATVDVYDQGYNELICFVKRLAHRNLPASCNSEVVDAALEELFRLDRPGEGINDIPCN